MSPPHAKDPGVAAPGPSETGATKQSITIYGTADRRVRAACVADLAAVLFVASPFLDFIYVDGRVPCPRCQRTAQDLAVHAPAGRVDAKGVNCELCGATTTRWLLERMVVEDADALDRLGWPFAEAS